MDRFNPQQKRGIALGLLLLVLFILISAIFFPLIMLYEEKKLAIQKLEHRLESYATIIESRNAIIQQVSTLKERIKSSAIFNTENSIPLATADMQQRIKNAVANAGGELSSTQNNPQKEIGRLLKISMNVRFSGSMHALQTILFELESAKPFMLIDKIKILGMSGSRNVHTGKIEPVDKVYISADVSSFIPIPEP